MFNREKKTFIREVHHVFGQLKSTKTIYITFLDKDYPPNLVSPHDNAPFITAQVSTMDLWYMLVDNRSLVDIYFVDMRTIGWT